MNVNCKLLSYDNGSPAGDENIQWWWNGAPVFGKEHVLKIFFNGNKLSFNKERGTFTFNVFTVHEAELGILEIFIYRRNTFFNELLGYTLKCTKEIKCTGSGDTHYLKIFPTNDSLLALLNGKDSRVPGFKPPEMGFFLALHITAIKCPLAPSVPYTLAVTRFITGDIAAERIMNVKEILSFLFRDIRDFTELAYGGRELMKYYASLEKREINRIKEVIFSNASAATKSIIQRAFQWTFGKKKTENEERKYAKHLLNSLPEKEEYKWHVKSKEFYLRNMKYYRYAISSYGSAFLSIHSILNVIKKSISKCKCAPCTEKPNGPFSAEKKFFHLFTGIPYNDILHSDSVYLAYVIFIERHTNTLFITFKGTLHTREALIDSDYKYYNYRGSLYHKGIFQEAQRFFQEKSEIISERMKEHNLHKIHLVGQSLGGALAALVCAEIKESPRFNQYRVGCTAYSAPPVVNSTKRFRKWDNEPNDSAIINIFYGSDMVPTLCLGKVLELRMVISHLYGITAGRYSNKLLYIHLLLKKLKRNGLTKLLTPGRIYKIRKCFSSPGAFLVRRIHWSENTSIKISTKALVHHTPGAMINALKKSLNYYYNCDTNNTC